MGLGLTKGFTIMANVKNTTAKLPAAAIATLPASITTLLTAAGYVAGQHYHVGTPMQLATKAGQSMPNTVPAAWANLVCLLMGTGLPGKHSGNAVTPGTAWGLLTAVGSGNQTTASSMLGFIPFAGVNANPLGVSAQKGTRLPNHAAVLAGHLHSQSISQARYSCQPGHFNGGVHAKACILQAAATLGTGNGHGGRNVSVGRQGVFALLPMPQLGNKAMPQLAGCNVVVGGAKAQARYLAGQAA